MSRFYALFFGFKISPFFETIWNDKTKVSNKILLFFILFLFFLSYIVSKNTIVF